eukprot:TRINITY_DN5636_c0_g1_i1.p1 TRINITY_DN5636_c0_g1~~TRINITY_DN5636_c0_g1_i1.p1  ORF type:complete len:433 (+),score=114.36 TRINITY_DN5636_c0_g1_i1:37-1335(+)
MGELAPKTSSTSVSSAVSEFKVPSQPPTRRRRPQKVLDEDDYVESISHIIEKDFFPDLAEIRKLNSETSPQASAAVEEEDEESRCKPTGGLDAFLSSHTGEDNESFTDIMEKAAKEESFKKEWLYLRPRRDEAESTAGAIEALKVPSIEEQAAGQLSHQPLQGWKYKSDNSVFYPVEGVPLSRLEEIEKAKKDCLVLHENTRFTSNPWGEDSEGSLSKKKDLGYSNGKVGADGKELEQPGLTPSVNGYKFMRHDSPAVDPSESPLMTWGKVDSTPLRLEESSSSPYINHGGSFKIQKVPERDQIALELTEKNAKFYRDKKQKAIQKACRNMKSPSGASMRIASMSPAAQRLATSKLGIRLGTDKSSRTPTPRSDRNPGTPLKNIISNSIRTKTPGPKDLTDGLLNIGSTPSSESLTDNLLNINKRSKASDFF